MTILSDTDRVSKIATMKAPRGQTIVIKLGKFPRWGSPSSSTSISTFCQLPSSPRLPTRAWMRNSLCPVRRANARASRDEFHRGRRVAPTPSPDPVGGGGDGREAQGGWPQGGHRLVRRHRRRHEANGHRQAAEAPCFSPGKQGPGSPRIPHPSPSPPLPQPPLSPP